MFAVAATLYFWWENIKGITESSEKALWIMQLTTLMVLVLIGWCGYTLLVRGGHFPPAPVARNIVLSKHALGWLYGSRIPQMFSLVAVFIALGHSVLAMSGAESLAQVYREIEHPKLRNLKKAALIIFIYSLVFTSLVSFFAVMIIPDKTRPQYFENLIGGLAMSLQGPFVARLAFHVFVVIVGTLILSGAVNTAIVGSNGVLNRVSEDGVLSDWFRQPHPTIRHFLPDHQHGGGAADCDDHRQPRRRDLPREPVRLRGDLELRAERHRRSGAALQAARRPRVSRSVEFADLRARKYRWALR